MKPSPWFRSLRLVGLLAVLSLLAGCFETTDEYTLNPDGSGKVVHETTMQPMNLTLDGSKSPERQLQSFVKSMFKDARGIEAWRDVSFQSLADGRIHFKGTAYFRDLSTLDFPSQTALAFTWERLPDGGGVLTQREKKSKSASGAKLAPEEDWSKLPPAERAARMQEQRAKFAQMKPMLTLIFGSMKHDVRIRLPGPATEVAGFTTDSAGELHLNFDGARIVAALDSLAQDEQWLNKYANRKNDEAMMGDEELSRLFGIPASAHARIGGAAHTAFDYEAEVAAAKTDFAQQQVQLGLEVPPPAPAASGKNSALKGLHVVAVRLVRESGEKWDTQPLNGRPGLTLAIAADFPGSVLEVTDDSGLDSVIADDGTDLLPESDFDRAIHFPKLSADRSSVLLEVEIKLPGPAVKGLRELSGHLRYAAATASKEVELGFGKIAANAKGKEFGAKIGTIKATGDGDTKSIEIHLDTDPTRLKALYLVLGQNRTELRRTGYNGGNDSFDFTFESENGFPSKARLVAEVYAELQTFDAPFKLENLSLLGEPLDAK